MSLPAVLWQGEHQVWLPGRALPHTSTWAFPLDTCSHLHPMRSCADICPSAALKLGAVFSPCERKVNPSRT